MVVLSYDMIKKIFLSFYSSGCVVSFVLVSIEKKYQTLKTAFDHIFEHI